MELEALAFPVVGERFVQPFEERAGPLGVLARRVVADDVVGRGVDAEAGRQLGEQLLGELGGRERLEGRVGFLAGEDRFAFDRVLGAVGRFEEDAAVLGFDEDAAGDGFLVAFVEEGDAFDGLGVFVGLRVCIIRGGDVGERGGAGFGARRARRSETRKCESDCAFVVERGCAIRSIVLLLAGDRRPR